MYRGKLHNQYGTRVLHTVQTKSIIEINDEGSVLCFGMNCQNFYQDFNWSPKYAIKDSIKSLIEYYQ